MQIVKQNHYSIFKNWFQTFKELETSINQSSITDNAFVKNDFKKIKKQKAKVSHPPATLYGQEEQ